MQTKYYERRHAMGTPLLYKLEQDVVEVALLVCFAYHGNERIGETREGVLNLVDSLGQKD